MIRDACAGESEVISDLALRSKAHWGYTAEQLAVFRAELTFAEADLARHRVRVLEGDGAIRGFYSLLPLERGEIELQHLFIDPLFLHRGYGTALFRDACQASRAQRWQQLVIQSDPNALGFYLAIGAQLEREIPSSLPGRVIPLLRYALG